MQRPDCFDFAMNFLGEPEAGQIRSYVERLELLAARNSQPQAPWQWLSEAKPQEGQQCEWVLLAPWGTDSGTGEWVVIDTDINQATIVTGFVPGFLTGFRSEKGISIMDPAITAWRSIATTRSENV